MGHEICIVCPELTKLTFIEYVKSLARKKAIIKQDLTFYRDKHLNNILLDHPPPIRDVDVPDADIVIATWWETAEWVATLSPSKGKKVYFIQHHEAHDEQPKERVIATYSLPLHKITISRWLKNLMNNRYGDPNVHLVFNSVDTEQFHAPIRSKNINATVGMLYSTIPWKGCDVSLDAFFIAAQKFPNLRLISFGNEDLSPDLPLPGNFQYYKNPKQNAIKNIYSQCTVWLCGSRTEGFHLPPLEAMACRCPIVSTCVGGPQDIIENGINGYLSPVGDASALADNLIKVLSLSEQDWQTLSLHAYKTAISYTWNDAAQLFEQALEKIRACQ
jgi:glycosyltransferase involved in cell wall biosynthesis